MPLSWIKRRLTRIAPASATANAYSNRGEHFASALGRIEGKIDETLRRLEAKADETLYGVELLRRRSGTYIGHDVVLTHLVDDTPIYANSYDFGGPANLLNGGLYEPENLDVILSFLRDDTVFLDIGANLGFFSLMVARRVHPHGKVHAFEPNPEMARLLRGSSYINGFGDLSPKDTSTIVIHSCGLGDTAIESEFWVPPNHAGGGVQLGGREFHGGTIFKSEVKKLDDVFGEGFVCDLVKIDVEGQEAAVLRGMKQTISASTDIKIIFEKLTVNAGNETELEAIFDEAGLKIYAIDPGARLRLLAKGELEKHDGYALATRDKELDNSVRNSFRIYPRQLRTVPQTLKELSRNRLCAVDEDKNLLFHGPYWFLRAGIYEFELRGEVVGAISFSVAARFGHVHCTALLSGANPKAALVIERDLLYFECIARAATKNAKVLVEGINVTRIG